MPYFHQQIDFTNLPIGTAPIIDTKNIGFSATKVYIDNYTSFYFYLPDAFAYIPPWWVGAVWKLHHTTDWDYVYLKSPFATTQSPTDPSYFLRLVWTNEEEVPLSQGSTTLGTSIDVTVGPPAVNVNVTGIESDNVAGVVPTSSYTVSCSTTVVDLAPNITGYSSLLIYNSGTSVIYIGKKSDLNASNANGKGIPIAVGGYYVYDINANALNLLGAVCASGTATAVVFRSDVTVGDA